jgi:aryl-alcohol dehydrogenase-like predicted oxidoreductase
MTTSRITIPQTELSVYPLCLGGNVFGWSADESQSHDVLDAYTSHGGNFIDTADVYSEWKDGNKGGDSEAIIGSWLKKRGNRSEVVIATKVAKLSTRPGLSAANIKAAVNDSLKRLQSEYIDIYYAHEDDQNTPLEETLAAFDEIVKSGKVRYIAASNYNSARLKEAIAISRSNNFAQYIAIQNHYNLLERKEYESDMAPALKELGLSGIPFFALARGFLSGKYRKGATIESVRAGGVASYLNDAGYALLEKLDVLAKSHNASVSAIAIAWLRAQPTISAPIASARTVAQLNEIVPIVTLSSEELASLTK